jgi:hypothetical protein
MLADVCPHLLGSADAAAAAAAAADTSVVETRLSVDGVLSRNFVRCLAGS